MFKRSVIAASIASSVLLSASANAYMFESTYTIGRGETTVTFNGTEADDKAKETVHMFDVQVHLQDVDVSKGAWNEAAFLNKSSYVGAVYTGTRSTFPGNDVYKSNGYGIGGRAVLNDFILEASIETSKDSDLDRSQTSSFGFGSYIGENHSIVGNVIFNNTDNFNSYLLSADYHGYFPIGSSQQSMALELTAYIENGSNRTDTVEQSGGGLLAKFTYYPFQQFGVGANVNAYSATAEIEGVSDDVENTNASVGVFANYYPVEQFRIGLELGVDAYELKDDDNKVESDTANVALDLRLRF